MAKKKMTFKSIRETGDPIIRIGYMDAYNLLSVIQPVGYNTGIQGWNCDIYRYCVNGICVWICTGSHPIGERLKESVAPYEEDAKQILSDWSKGYEDKRDQIAFLLDQWLTKGLGLE